MVTQPNGDAPRRYVRQLATVVAGRSAVQSHLLLIALLFSSASFASDKCIHFREAREHIGAMKCVQGKVLHVKEGEHGATFLDFCEDYRACTFTVVVFARDLKHIGDVRYLSGKDVSIHGKIQEYDGRAEIVLNRYQQLRGETAQIPPLPKDYDVEKRGRYSAGTFSHPTATRKPSRKKQQPAVSIEDVTADSQE